MDFIRFIRSLEELLYEVLTWLLLYPTTLWSVIRHPLKLAARADDEMSEALDEQFIDMVSPPLFLMLSILLAHVLEIALHQSLGAGTTSLARSIIGSQQNLLMFRCVTFGLYPIMMAAGYLRRTGQPVDRNSLRRPFFLQCYFTAPFALLSSASTLFLFLHLDAPNLLALPVIVAAFGWYAAVQTEWFRTHLGISRLAAFWMAVRLIGLTMVIDVAVAALIFGPGAANLG